MNRYRIGIAGCGPAGMATALFLHRQGHELEIFERFAKPRAVGSGLMLQPTGLAVLANLGLADSVKRVGSPIHRLSGRSAKTNRKVLDVRYSWLGQNSPCALGIHRSALFDILFEEVTRRGIRVRSDHEVEGSSVEDGGRALLFANRKKSRPFDLIVDCAGMRSRLSYYRGRNLAYGALWATVDWPREGGFDQQALEQRYVGASIMVGMMPTGERVIGQKLGTFFWSLKESELHAWQNEPFDAWKNRVLKVWPAMAPVLKQLTSAEQLSFARYSHRTLPSPVGPHIFHLGDSWHSTSPQLGQGANMALLDAYALATAIASERDLPAALNRASRLRQRHVRLYQTLSLGLTPFYQSDSRTLPFIRDFLVPHVAKVWPATWIQAAMVSGLLGNPLAKLGLEPC